MKVSGTATKIALFATLALLLQCALVQSSVLAGTTWTITGYTPGGGAHDLGAGSEVTLEFGPKGQAVFGSGGCNRYRATALLSNGTLALGPVLSTRVACAADVNRQEMMYLTLIKRVSTFTLEGNALVLGLDDADLTFTASGAP